MRSTLAALSTAVLLLTVGLVDRSHAQGTARGLMDAVPDSASVVVRLKSPSKSVAKVADFVNSVQPGFGMAVTANLPELGRVIGVPGLKGVDLEKDIWVIIFTESQTPPKQVFALSAKDVEAVKRAVQDNFEVYTSGSMVLYSEDEGALAEVRKCLAGDAKPLWSKIDPASKTLFEALDLAALVHIKQLTEDYSNEYDQAEPLLESFLENVTNALPDDQQQQIAPVLEIYGVVGKALLTGIRDSNSWTTGLAFTKTAIRYQDRLQVSDETVTSRFLAKHTPGDLSLLSRLPANKSVYVGLKFDLSDMLDWSMKLTKGLILNRSAEEREQFDSACKEMANLKYDEVSMYMDLEGTAPALRIGAVTTVTDGKRAKEIGRKLQQSLSEITTSQFTQTTKLEINAEKVNGQDVDRVTVKQTHQDSADPLGIRKKIWDTFFGDEGMSQLMLYQATRSVQTFGNGTAEMKGLVDSLESTKSTDAAFELVRTQLFEKANFLAMLDLARITSRSLTLADSQKLFPLNSAALSSIKLDSSYVGYAVTIEPTSIRSQLEIPAAQIQNLVKFIPVFQPQR